MSLSQDSAASGVPASDDTIAATDAGSHRPSGALRDSVLPHGTRVGRYTVLELLGAGGMGVVYAAYDPQLDRRVAVKLLHDSGCDSAASKARGQAIGEAKTLARLSHPNVVAVHDAGRVEDGVGSGAVYLAMELVEGSTLSDWLAQRQRNDALDWRTTLAVFIQAGRGLVAAHEAGLVHRDFKPQNVLISGSDRDLRARVADFGLAVATTAGSNGGEDSQVRLDVTAGTPAYMAPEQIAHETIGAATDQFAFCVALFEALFGQHPFARDSMIEQADAVLHEPPIIPAGARRVPPWLRRAIFIGLARDPAERHPSMDALVTVLSRDRWLWFRRAVLGAAALTVAGGVVYAGALATEPGLVRVTVTDESGVVIPDATVRVGDTNLELSGEQLTGRIPSGTYVLAVDASDYDARRSVVEVTRGGEHALSMSLSHEQGTIDLQVQPRGATVLVDGVDRGSRLVGLALNTGRHDVVVRKTGHYERRLSLVVDAALPIDRFVSLPSAVAFASRTTGPGFEMVWGGDATGDGRPEVYARTFSTMHRYDPWTGDTLWSLSTQDIFAATFRFGDVDGDGALDVVRALDGSEGGLGVFSGVQQTEPATPLWDKRWEVTGGDSNGPSAALSVQDLDGDGRAEVVTSLRWEDAVVARSGLDGRTLWRTAVDGPLIAVEGDRGGGSLAISATQLTKLNAVGSVAWQVPWSEPAGGRAGLHFNRRSARGLEIVLGTHDLNGDGTDDIVLPLQTAEGPALRALEAETGATLWTVASTATSPEALPRADLDGDGTVDLLVPRRIGDAVVTALVSGRTGRDLAILAGRHAVLLTGYAPLRILVVDADAVRVFSGTGQLLSESSGHNGLVGRGTAFDHNGDGTMEAAFVDASPGLRIFDGEARDVAFVPTFSPLTQVGTGADLDGDGFADLLARGNGVVRFTAERTVWQREARAGIRVSAVAVDGDGDGDLELAVFGAFDERPALNLFDARTGQLLARGERSQVIRTPAVGSFRGRPAIMSQSMNGYFAINSAIDATLLEREPIATSYATPALGDVDGDGRDEVMLMPWKEGARARMLQLPSKTELWSYPAEDGSWMQPQIVELDGASPAEVITATNLGVLELRSGADGTLRWSKSLGPMKHTFPPAVIATAGGGLVLVHAPAQPPRLLALDARDGTQRWSVDGPTSSTGPVAADVDGDGIAEVFSGTARGLVSVDLDGQQRWEHLTSTPQFGTYVAAQGALVLGDVDHDGRSELLSAFSDGSMRIVDAQTGELRVRISGTGERIESAPALIDVDGDGFDEVVVGGHDRWLRCFRLPRSAFDD